MTLTSWLQVRAGARKRFHWVRQDGCSRGCLAYGMIFLPIKPLPFDAIAVLQQGICRSGDEASGQVTPISVLAAQWQQEAIRTGRRDGAPIDLPLQGKSPLRRPQSARNHWNCNLLEKLSLVTSFDQQSMMKTTEWMQGIEAIEEKWMQQRQMISWNRNTKAVRNAVAPTEEWSLW